MRRSVADNPYIPADTLVKLADDVDETVRKAVADNPRTPKDLLVSLVTDTDKDVRIRARRNLYTSAEAYRQTGQPNPSEAQKFPFPLLPMPRGFPGKIRSLPR